MTEETDIHCDLCERILPGRHGLEIVWVCNACQKEIANPHFILNLHAHQEGAS